MSVIIRTTVQGRKLAEKIDHYCNEPKGSIRISEKNSGTLVISDTVDVHEITVDGEVRERTP